MSKYKFILFLGLLVFIFNDELSGLFYNKNTIEFYKFNNAINSISFFLLSMSLFYNSRLYLRIVLRWFMIYALIDFHSKIYSNNVNFDLIDTSFVLQIVILCVFEIFVIYKKKISNEKV